MADKVYRFQVRFPMDNNDPSDVVVNTWHFSADEANLNPWADPITWLDAFYQGWDARMSSKAGGNTPTYKVYDLADPIPRAPIHEGNLTVITGGADAAPAELAVCMSYYAAFASGVPKARRRGRVYLGPWAITNLDSGGLVAGALITPLLLAANNLLDASQASADEKWVVYSPTAGDFHEVVGGWIDDAWDIQRRRGVNPTTRNPFS